MKFEYDPGKSTSNKVKHGMDFDKAQELWESKVLEIPAAHRLEQRFAAIGVLRGIYWTAIFTYRGSAIRLISCRRSHKQEVILYEQYTKTD
ncbi:hypothetical protein FACS1894206_07270 [Deltaproteobacteria bacterium]|nr:hypothetical protein FACS1894206_07270 [Deltaproteobacteria bacterium]